jgi:hypothetical protein
VNGQSRFLRLLIFIVITLAFLDFHLGAQEAPLKEHPANLDLWARLSGALDTSRIKVGDEVSAVVKRESSFGTCYVAEGSVLHGKVVAFVPWSDASRKTELAIEFTARCGNGESLALPLIAAAYAGNDPKSASQIMDDLPAGLGPGVAQRGMAPLTGGMPSEVATAEKFPALRPGQVQGLHHVWLAMGTGPRETTMLGSPDRRLRLEKGTRLAFFAAMK